MVLCVAAAEYSLFCSSMSASELTRKTAFKSTKTVSLSLFETCFSVFILIPSSLSVLPACQSTCHHSVVSPPAFHIPISPCSLFASLPPLQFSILCSALHVLLNILSFKGLFPCQLLLFFVKFMSLKAPACCSQTAEIVLLCRSFMRKIGSSCSHHLHFSTCRNPRVENPLHM